jgi:hypothetical protein
MPRAERMRPGQNRLRARQPQIPQRLVIIGASRTSIARLNFLSVLAKRGANPTIRENAQDLHHSDG